MLGTQGKQKKPHPVASRLGDVMVLIAKPAPEVIFRLFPALKSSQVPSVLVYAGGIPHRTVSLNGLRRVYEII